MIGPPSTDDAPCHPDNAGDHGASAEDWFGDPKMTPALRLCRTRCPVRADCLAYTLQFTPQPPGVWAGLTEYDRTRIATRYRRRNGIRSVEFMEAAPRATR